MPWRDAYLFALYLAAAAAVPATLAWAFGLQVNLINILVAAAIGVAHLVGGLRLIAAGGILAALPWFLIGSGIFFGFGTVIATQSDEVMAQLSFTEDVQRLALAKVNAANAIAMAIVVAAAGPFCMARGGRGGQQPGLHRVIEALAPSLQGMMVASVPITILVWATFPTPSSLLLASLLAVLRGIPLFAIMIGAILWERISLLTRMLVILMVIALSLNGFLGLSKMQTLLPIVILGLGWWLGAKMRRYAIVLLAMIGTVYFGGLADIVGFGRFNPNYDPIQNSPQERVEIIIETSAQLQDLADHGEESYLLNRFTLAPFEAYFMFLYDDGSPGDSLRNAGIVLIPRAIWPEKPTIEPGAEFDLIFRGQESESNLGIGFVAEAYWNHGWPGIFVLSIYIGLVTGWFTRKWLLFAEHGATHAGIFVFSPLVVLAAGAVEKNIVAGHIGGMVKLAITIMFVDLVLRSFLAQRAKYQHA